jgi:HK97 family phage major capsid protein
MKQIKLFETLNSIQDMQIVESEKSDSLMHLEGVFGVCGVLNNNNRIYTKENYTEMVESVQDIIEKHSFLGTLEHDYSLGTNLNNVSHRVDSLSIDEDGVVRGSLTILNTPKGQIAKAIIEAGSPLYVSSKAVGTIDEDSNTVTLTRLFGYDLVGSPGFSEAEVNLKENENIMSLCENACIISEAEDKDDKEDEKEETKESEDETKDNKSEETKESEDEKEDNKEDKKEETKDSEDKTEDTSDDKDDKEDKEDKEDKTNENLDDKKLDNIQESDNNININETNKNNSQEVNETNKYISRNTKMNKHYYLAEAFRSAINRKPFGEELTNIFQEANKEMADAEITLEGGMMNVIPFGFISEADTEQAPAWPIQGHELNATVDNTHGKALVHTQYNNPLMPIMNDEILGEFTWFTGLRGTFATNRFGAAKAYWKGELKKADPTKMKFDAIEAKPKRLTTYVDISRQELIQSDYNLESYIRAQLAEAITLKLQHTILGASAGDDVTPQGLFYNATELNALSFANLVNIEKQAKLNGVRRATKYFISPDIEATLRTTLKSQVAGAQYILDNDRILGKEYVANEDIAGIAYGDPKSVAICVWGPGVVVNFNPYSLDLYDAYRFVVNMYVDVLYLNPLKGEEDNATAVPQLLPFVLGE